MSHIAKNSSGFGLVEVLITAVILAIGLIGIASVQVRSIRAIQEGDNLVTAAMIGQEMTKRMLANGYITSLGRQGYLALDLSDDIQNAGGVPDWAQDTITNSPNILNCYAEDNTESCYAPGATIGDSAAHIVALQNMALMDQVEMRLLAWSSLPEGQIMICFDSTDAYTSWACDDVATRIDDRSENVFTVKVGWNSIFDNEQQQYTTQFTATCTINNATYCG